MHWATPFAHTISIVDVTYNLLTFQALQAADDNAVAVCFANEAGFGLTNVQ